MKINNQPKSKKRTRKKLRIVPGAPPGTLNIDPHAEKPVITLFAYEKEKFIEEKIDDLGKISEYINPYSVLWVNVDGLGDEKTLLDTAKIFEIHPLVLEDIIHTNQRPKLDDLQSNIYIVTRMFTYQEKLDSEQFSLILGKNYVVTFQETQGDCLEVIRNRIRTDQGRVRSAGADYLAYCILDSIVDNYFPFLENFGEKLEKIEEKIFSKPHQRILDQIHQLKRGFQSMRRTLWPTRDVLNRLNREEFPLVQKESQIYFRDVLDHAVQVLDLVETYKEICADLGNLYLSSLSNKMNEVMKVLTMIATLFIPLSFIAGLYGMNFNPEKSPWNMPELNWFWGYPFALGIMAAISAGMLWFFYEKGWIGRK